MEAGILPPLSYYFARFVARGCGLGQDSLLAYSAALASMRNLHGDVCVDLARYVGKALFDEVENTDEDAPPIAVPQGPVLNDWLTALRAADWVGTPGREAPLILDGRRLYLGKYWRFEQQVATALRARMTQVGDLDSALLAEGLNRLFRGATDGAVDWQKVAAAIALGRRFAVISGGPGTGKTTTVVKVLALLLEQNPALRIALAAPTGKAATRLAQSIRDGKKDEEKLHMDARLRERIPDEAGTIHRLLGSSRSDAFKHNGDNPLPLDCLVVDEASMIDLPLMARLLDALHQDARLILLGDRDQLASVEAGNVLGDITGHGREIRYSADQVRFLEQVGAAPAGTLPYADEPSRCADAVGLLRISYRFKEGSGIATLARAVNKGRGEDALELVAHRRFHDSAWERTFEAGWDQAARKLYNRRRFADIAWLDAEPERLNAACIGWGVERYTDYLRQQKVSHALRFFEQSRVLAALRQGPFGVEEINRSIEARLQALGLVQGGSEYQGKPVMVTVNDYEVGLFNGDIGLLWHDGKGKLRAYFHLAEDETDGGDETDGINADKPLRSVPIRQLPEHDCAYALTVHKSQGSEFDEVMLVLPFDESPVVTRELVYTGITRARERVTVQGGRESFRHGCQQRVERTSALAEKLGW